MFFYKIPYIKNFDKTLFLFPTEDFIYWNLYFNSKKEFLWKCSEGFYTYSASVGAEVVVSGIGSFSLTNRIYNGALQFLYIDDPLRPSVSAKYVMRNQNYYECTSVIYDDGVFSDFSGGHLVITNSEAKGTVLCYQYFDFYTQEVKEGETEKIEVRIYATGAMSYFMVKMPTSLFEADGIVGYRGASSQSKTYLQNEDNVTPKQDRLVYATVPYKNNQIYGKYVQIRFDPKKNKIEERGNAIYFGYRKCQFQVSNPENFGLEQQQQKDYYCTSSTGDEKGLIRIKNSEGFLVASYYKGVGKELPYLLYKGIKWTPKKDLSDAMKDILRQFDTEQTYEFVGVLLNKSTDKTQKVPLTLKITKDFTQGKQFVDCYWGDVAVW